MTEAIRRAARLAFVLAAVATAGYWALAWAPSVLVDGAALPTGHDAVYHAGRILDAVDAPWSVTQFDRRIHAPEGSWVNWPWGFDTLMALILRVLRDAAGLQPALGLVFLPPAFLLVNAALLVGIVHALRLPPAQQALVLVCFALSPLTQNLHGLGMVDHHFLEYTAVLAAMLCGLRLFAAPERLGPAVALGLVLGLANAVHNGLFILQLPVLAAWTVLGWKRLGPGPRVAAGFGLALVLGTLAAAAPSAALRAGFVRYDLLSWFHVHAACLSALAVGLLARRPPGRREAAAAGALLLVAALPLLGQAAAGVGFVSAAMYRTWLMPEMHGPFDGLLAGELDLPRTLRDYSGLILLLPLTLAAGAAVAVRTRDPRLAFACVYLVCGGLLLLVQYRFHPFGSLALYLLPLALLADRLPAPRHRHMVALGSAAAVALAYWPCLDRLRELPPPGGSVDFALTRALYPPLTRACRERPGVVLADHTDGHYIRLLTDCAVVANNLVLGPESWAKLRQSEQLLDADPDAVRARAPWVRYVLVRRDDDVFASLAPAEIRRQNSALRRALLFAGPPWPPGYRLLQELRLQAPGAEPAVLGRVFELGPDPAAP